MKSNDSGSKAKREKLKEKIRRLPNESFGGVPKEEAVRQVDDYSPSMVDRVLEHSEREDRRRQ